MSKRSLYDGHSDFYLIGLWQGRDAMAPEARDGLRAEMRERGLDTDEPAGPGEPYRDVAAAPTVGPACPVCGLGMRDGQVLLHREESVFGALSDEGLAVDLYFRPRRGNDTIVFRRGESRPATLCESCGTVIVRGHFTGETGDR